MQARETQTKSGAPEHKDVALVVDLDGTLCRTDTLHEALLALATTRPLDVFRVPFWLAEGKAGLKARLADRGVVAPDELPYNEAVIGMLTTARAEGRHTALVSAADHRQVTSVAEATELFDEAYGSAEGRNLKGAAKAAFLSEHFGPGMYDYIGDSFADLPVWAGARSAITVRAGRRLRSAATSANSTISHIDPPTGRARAMTKAMRPHQWSKNLLMFLPALAAHDPTGLWPALLGFLAFCMTASAVYVINDLLDLSADRAHPRKKNRPFAAGDLSATTGAGMAAGLLAVAFTLGITMGNPTFLGVLTLYLAATFAYSFWLKRKLIADVITLAGLYTIRIVAGAAMAMIPLSPWLLGFSMFLFLALAAVKRQTELIDQMRTERASSGRAYNTEDLPILRGMAISASQAAVLVLALYISSDDVQRLYEEPWPLWLICPILLYWSMRMIMKAHRGQMTDDPIIFAVTDRISLALIVLSATFVVMAAL